MKKALATVFGIGYIPKLPGTCGSLAAVGVAGLLVRAGIPIWTGAGVATVLALWSAGPAARQIGKEDPSSIVIDEVAGMLVTLIGVPFTLKTALAGFLLFRFFDIVKPPPIRQIQRLPGSFGIVLDDLLAGGASWLCLRILTNS